MSQAGSTKPPHWRIEIVIRNIEGELPHMAVGTLTIDTENAETLDDMLEVLETGLTNPLEQSVTLRNEIGECLGFNPHHYSYHRVFKGPPLGPRRGPECKWVLPAKKPRGREK
jgi:hypothetical protein